MKQDDLCGKDSGVRTERLYRVCLRLGLRGLRLWWREGTWTVARRAGGKLVRRLRGSHVVPTGETTTAPARPAQLGRGPDRIGGASVPTERKFRVVIVGSETRDFQSMRYRAHHVVEALALAGLEAVFVPDEQVAEQFSLILSHDLIVLARLLYSEVIAELMERARRLGIPLVYDIDDYVFEPWVLPYVESYRDWARPEALRTMSLRGRCLDRCDYFTGSTLYLAERAAAHGKKTFVLRNGLSALQVELSRQAGKERQAAARADVVRIGYFSGTRTHQADFRIVYPALMALLRAMPSVRLVIVGYLDLDEFSGLAPFADRIDMRPPRDWRELPAEIAQVDINLIPLELNPFNEGKSNLKYYEAGLLQIPSIASPTRILRASITHGHNGLLARTTDEWYAGLKELTARADERERLGHNAYEHVLRNYVPEVVAAEAVATYRHILRMHRSRRGFAENALSIVMLVHVSEGPDREVLQQANDLAAAGHAITMHVSTDGVFASAAALEEYISRQFFEPRFAVQLGGEIPCCDVLIATDPQTEELAGMNRHRAPIAVSLAPLGKDVVESGRLPMIRETGEGLAAMLRELVQTIPADPKCRAA
jgi:glycosyltransferase involved in cell wall biosynthesis